MKLDVLIVGAGLAGASLAVALGRSRLRVGLVDSRRPQRPRGWDQRVYAVSPANQGFLQQLGVWSRLERTRLQPVYDMKVFGDAASTLHFSAYDSGVSELAWIVESSLLHCELWETLVRQHNIELFCPAQATSLVSGKEVAQVTLDDGARIEARLVVGADGLNSWVREQAGIGTDRTSYGERGVVANFECAHEHHGTALQWFRSDGVLALLPLPQRRVSMVWSTPDEHARELLAREPVAFAEYVSSASDNALGRLRLETPPAAFPLQLLRVEHMISERVALLGDAAHAIHPLSGHGVNLGFQDAKVLADKLVQLPSWRDPGERTVLRAYERARAEEPWLMQNVTHALNRLFKCRNPWVRSARNRGMQLTDRFAVVKSAMIRYATTGGF